MLYWLGIPACRQLLCSEPVPNSGTVQNLKHSLDADTRSMQSHFALESKDQASYRPIVKLQYTNAPPKTEAAHWCTCSDAGRLHTLLGIGLKA